MAEMTKLVWKARTDGAWFGYRLNARGVMEKRPRVRIGLRDGKWRADALIWADPEEEIYEHRLHLPVPRVGDRPSRHRGGRTGRRGTQPADPPGQMEELTGGDGPDETAQDARRATETG